MTTTTRTVQPTLSGFIASGLCSDAVMLKKVVRNIANFKAFAEIAPTVAEHGNGDLIMKDLCFDADLFYKQHKKYIHIWLAKQAELQNTNIITLIKEFDGIDDNSYITEVVIRQVLNGYQNDMYEIVTYYISWAVCYAICCEYVQYLDLLETNQ